MKQLDHLKNKLVFQSSNTILILRQKRRPLLVLYFRNKMRVQQVKNTKYKKLRHSEFAGLVLYKTKKRHDFFFFLVQVIEVLQKRHLNKFSKKWAMNIRIVIQRSLFKPAFMYLPACLMSQTEGLSASSPRTTLSNNGLAAVVIFGSATVPTQDFLQLEILMDQKHIPMNCNSNQMTLPLLVGVDKGRGHEFKTYQ